MAKDIGQGKGKLGALNVIRIVILLPRLQTHLAFRLPESCSVWHLDVLVFKESFKTLLGHLKRARVISRIYEFKSVYRSLAFFYFYFFKFIYSVFETS